MDNSKDVTMVEWCAGYGGIHLGLKRSIPNLRVIAYGEIEAFACANLVAKMEAGLMDAAPVWTDIKTFPCEEFRDRVDILVAGYPCQPFSAAGKRQGADDPRHLWPHIRRAVGIIRPRICFFENVEGHISLGLSTVISDLEEDGYRTTWGIFSAAEVGAPHQRKRIFILAYDQRQRIEELGWQIAVGSQQHSAWNDGGMGNAKHNGLHGAEVARGHEANAGTRASQKPQMVEQCEGAGCVAGTLWPARPGEPQHEWEPPRVVGNGNGINRSASPEGRLNDAEVGQAGAGQT